MEHPHTPQIIPPLSQDFCTFEFLILWSYQSCEQEAPEYFNFASDVLDKWSQIEKVTFLTL